MKITNVSTAVIQGNFPWVLVKVETDGGVAGLGEAYWGAGVAELVHKAKPLLIGEDPVNINRLVEVMIRCLSGEGSQAGATVTAISGIEIALWDLLGKALGAPVCALLGGAIRPRLPAYASLLRYDAPGDVARACRHFASQGFRMLKLHQTDVESVRAAREAVGPDVDLMLDANCPWSPEDAIAMARALAPHRLFWLEEPVWPPEDYAGLARVAAATETPIALGENESTLFGFREIVERRAADILQPSITKVGGISEFRKIAALAQAVNVPIAPHSFYFGPGLAATLHVAASFGGSLPVEFPTGELETPFLARPIEAHDGWVEVPQGPGLGVEVNEDAIRRYPYAPAGAQPFLLNR